MAMSKFAPGHCGGGDCACGPPPDPCQIDFTVSSPCGPDVPLPGASCKVWTNSGKTTLLGSATTDGSGTAILSIVVPSPFYWEISHPSGRFAVASGTTSCGSLLDAQIVEILPVADGYHCFSTLCAYPLADTLHMSSAATGAVTMTWDGLTWSGTGTINLGGPFVEPGCSSGVVSLLIAFTAGLTYEALHKIGTGGASCGTCVAGIGTAFGCGGLGSGNCAEDGAFVYTSTIGVRVGDGGTVTINATVTE